MEIALAILTLVVIAVGVNEFRVMARDKRDGYKFRHTNPDDKTSLGSASQTSEPVGVSKV